MPKGEKRTVLTMVLDSAVHSAFGRGATGDMSEKPFLCPITQEVMVDPVLDPEVRLCVVDNVDLARGTERLCLQELCEPYRS